MPDFASLIGNPGVVFDLGNYLGVLTPRQCHSALLGIYGATAPKLAEYYARRLQALNYNAAVRLTSLAKVVPGTVIHGQIVTSSFKQRGRIAISEDAFASLLRVSDPASHSQIVAIVDGTLGDVSTTITSGNLFRGREELGLLRFTRNEYVNPIPYLCSPIDPGRAGVSSSLSKVAFVVAVRTETTGLLLGSGVIFQGEHISAEQDRFPPGWILFGSKHDLSAGTYRIELDLVIQEEEEIVVDVVSNHGLVSLIELRVRGTTRINIAFQVGLEDEQVEVRMVNLSDSVILGRIEKIVVLR